MLAMVKENHHAMVKAPTKNKAHLKGVFGGKYPTVESEDR